MADDLGVIDETLTPLEPPPTSGPQTAPPPSTLESIASTVVATNTVALAAAAAAKAITGKSPPLLDRMWGQLGAGFSLENMTVAAAEFRPPPDAARFDPNFRLFDHLTLEEQLDFEPYSGANSVADLEFYRERRRKELELRERLKDGPLPEWLAASTASMLDLPTLLPLFGPISRGRPLANVFAIGGSAVAGAAAQEAVLQTAVRTRTMEEGAASVLLAAVMGTGIGVLAGRGKALISAGPSESLLQDTAAMIRYAGLGDEPPVASNLLGTTGLSRILQADSAASKPWSLDVLPVPKSLRDVSDQTVLELAMRQHKGLFGAVNDAEAAVVDLQTRIAAAESRALEAAIDPVMSAAGVRPGIILPDLRAKLAQAEQDRSMALTRAWDAVFALERKTAQIDVKMTPAAQADAIDKLLEAREGWLTQIEADAAARALTFGDVLRLDKLPRLDQEPLSFLDGIAEQALARQKAQAAKKPAAKKPPPGKEPPEGPTPQAGGAAASGVPLASLGAADWSSQLANSFGMLTLIKQLDRVRLAPIGLVLGMSPFSNTRRLAQQISNHGMITQGELKGVPSANDLHALTQVKRAVFWEAMPAHVTAFKEWQTTTGRMMPWSGRAEFNERVGRAMSRGDESDDPAVAKAAKAWRQVDDKLFQEAKKLGIVKEDLDLGGTAPTHFRRKPLVDRILAQREAFRDLIARWYEVSDTQGKHTKADYREAAEQVIEKYLKMPTGRLPSSLNFPGPRGSLRERTHLIPDDFEFKGVRFDDFMDKNVERVMAEYVNMMASDIEYFRMFPKAIKELETEGEGAIELGLEEVIKPLREEWKAVADAASSEKAKLRISKQGMKDEENLRWLVERTRGVSRQPVSAVERGLNETLKNVRSGTSMLRLGTSIFAQIADLGKTTLEEGLGRYFGTAIVDMVTGLKGLKIATSEARRAHTAIDLDTAATARALMDIGDQYPAQWKFTRGMDMATHTFFVANLMSPVAAFMKGHLARLSIDRMIRGVQKINAGEALSRRETIKLAEAGIGPYEAKLIAAQADKFEKYQGLWVAHTDKWTDPDTVRLFRSGIYRGVTNGMITPSPIDKSTFVQDWPTLFQFRSFGSASIGRLMIRSLQFHDAQTLSAIVTAVGAGALGVAMRDIATEGQIKERSQAKWVADAIDRSGIMWIFFEADAILDKMTAGRLSPVQQAIGEQSTRTSASGLVSRVLGPNAGLIYDFGTATQNAAKGEFTQKDLHRMITMTPLGPLQNLLWTRYVFGQMEKSLGQGLGLPEADKKGRVLP